MWSVDSRDQGPRYPGLQQLAIALGWTRHRSMNAYSGDLRKKRSSRPKSEGCPPSKSRSHLRRGPLLRQALRQGGPGRGIAAPQEEPGQAPEGRRARKEALLGGAPAGATRRRPLGEARVPAERGRARGERVHRQQRAPSHGMDPKKRRAGASERDEFLRAAWQALVAGGMGAERSVFVDETGSNTSLAAPYACSRLGGRARCSVPRNRGKNTTLLASMTSEGMGPCLAVVGSTTAALFEAYVGRALAPALRGPGRWWCSTTPRGAQGRAGARADRGERSRAVVLAALLVAGPRPRRGGVLEGERVVAAGTSTNPKGLGRGDGQGVGCGDRRGHPRVLRALRLPVFGPTSMTTALESRSSSP